MGLGEHELEGWEGPTQGEVSRDVAVDVSIHTRRRTKTSARSSRRWKRIPGGNNSISCPPRLVTPDTAVLPVRYFG